MRSLREGVVIIERRINASPATVCSFFSSSERWALWQGERATIDFRPEGAVHPVPPGSSTVEIEFLGDGKGTLLRLRHSNLPEDFVARGREGWRHYTGRLLVRAEGGDPGPDGHF